MRATNVQTKARKQKAMGGLLDSATTVPAETLEVRVRPDCTVNYEEVNVRKSAGDQVRWQSQGPAFDIHFEDTPFVDASGNKKHDFRVPAGKTVTSGPPVIGEPRKCAYTIRHATLGLVTDPSVSVRP